MIAPIEVCQICDIAGCHHLRGMTPAYLPKSVSSVRIDTGEACHAHVSHDGEIIFLRQSYESGVSAARAIPEIELTIDEARALAAVLIGMADMLERRE